jgi:hypothetical protein
MPAFEDPIFRRVARNLRLALPVQLVLVGGLLVALSLYFPGHRYSQVAGFLVLGAGASLALYDYLQGMFSRRFEAVDNRGHKSGLSATIPVQHQDSAAGPFLRCNGGELTFLIGVSLATRPTIGVPNLHVPSRMDYPESTPMGPSVYDPPNEKRVG